MNKYDDYKTACLQCRVCHDAGLCCTGAYPLFMEQAPINTDILLIGEAPNWNDTFTPSKGYLTVGPSTDPSGSFGWAGISGDITLN
jgi:hypothetical protein